LYGRDALELGGISPAIRQVPNEDEVFALTFVSFFYVVRYSSLPDSFVSPSARLDRARK
jgi:hypothetical protein